MKHLISITILLAFIALAACSAVAGAAENPLAGTVWVLTSLEGEPPIEGTAPSLSFGEDTLGGSAGCNSFGGEYEVRSDQLKVGEIAATLMACDSAAVMEQERSYVAVLRSAQTFSFSDSELRITTAEGGELVFARQE